MGTSCSKLDKDSDPDHRREKEFDGPAAKLHRKFASNPRGSRMDDSTPKESLVIGRFDKKASTKLDNLASHKQLFYEKQDLEEGKAQGTATEPQQLEPEYFRDRNEIARRGQQLAFDYALTVNAGTSEKKANEILEIIRHNDEIAFYSLAEPLKGYRGQKHHRFAGDHFLTNLELLGQTVLLRVAQKMPKGGHLHIHFNSTLLPDELLNIADTMEQMYISSDKPLTSVENCDTCEIQFLMKSEAVVADDRAQLQTVTRKVVSASPESTVCNLFHQDYTQGLNEKNQRLSWMKYRTFREQWAQISRRSSATKKGLVVEDLQSLTVFGMSSKDWLISKLVFDDQEAHNSHQTSEG